MHNFTQEARKDLNNQKKWICMAGIFITGLLLGKILFNEQLTLMITFVVVAIFCRSLYFRHKHRIVLDYIRKLKNRYTF